MKKLVLFDFDGTIADTSEGILDSHIFTLGQMGKKIPSDNQLRKLIGGNLLQIYTKFFEFAEDEAREAIRIYRKRYAEFGICKAVLYPGFDVLLKELKEKGMDIGVATLKSELFAKKMLFNLGISQYFDVICGMDQNDSLDKAKLITRCVTSLHYQKDETIFVGDTDNDFYGAKEAGVNFVAVSYGFGYKAEEHYDDFVMKKNTKELLRYLVN